MGLASQLHRGGLALRPHFERLRFETAVLGPVNLPEGQLTMRSPQLRDASAWSAERRANQKWLESAFPAWGADWAAEQSEAAWVQRWWHLRRAAARGRAAPFVLLLDGRLIGELGIDAVDEISNSGEASVWMVREHGSSAVMNTASLLLIDHCMSGPAALDRIISPVATSSRKGRAPGLTAVGLTIEATVRREVGAEGMVDHDIWVLHNTDPVRAKVAGLLAGMTVGAKEGVPAGRKRGPGMTGESVVLARAIAHAGVRGIREQVRVWRRPQRAWENPPPPQVLAGSAILTGVRPGSVAASGVPVARVPRADRQAARRGALVPWVVVRDREPVGEVRVSIDAGTGIAEINAWVQAGVERGVLETGLRLTLQAIEQGRLGGARTAVRVPADAHGRTVPDADLLTSLGFTLVATYAGSPDGPRRWAGEQRWEPIARARSVAG